MSVPLLDVRDSAARVTLQLGQSFTASGFVRFTNGAEHSAALQVTAYAWKGASSIRAAQARVLADGSIAPFKVPLFETDGYDFVVRGGNALPGVCTIRDPGANDQLQLSFALTAGATISVRTQDEDALPLSGARILVQWEADGGEAQVGMTGEDGVALIKGVHESSVEVIATAEGFIPARAANVNVKNAQGGLVLLTMVRGGTLTGRVMRGESHVETFSVVYWPPSDPTARLETSFQAAANGEFEVEGLPVGELLVFAYSPDCPRSEVRNIRIDRETASSVLLELPEPIVGKGRIVDAATGTAVPTATIQLWNSYRAGYLIPFGGLHSVGQDGSFSVSGFAPGDSRFVIRSTGYAQYLGQAMAVADQELDLGIIALHKEQELRVRLTSPVQVDFTRFEANADGNAPYPTRTFSPEGVVSWNNAGPNLYFVRVYLPDGSRMYNERYCRPGADWEFVFPLDPTRTLQLALVDESGLPGSVEGPMNFRLTYTGAGGHQLVHTLTVTEPKAYFSSVSAGSVYAEVINEVGDIVSAQHLTLNEGHNKAQLKTGGKSVCVRVTNPDGIPLEGATLDARMAAGESPWFQLTSTDAKGMHTFTGLGMQRIFINVQHNQYGVRSDVEVDLDTWKSEEVLEIELDPKATVAVRLVDGKTPVPAASVRILAPHSHHILGVFTSDAGGMVRYGPVTPGTYLVSVEQPGIWLTEQLVEAGDKDQPHDVQVRKLGELALRLESESGEAVGGIRVELEAVDGGATLSDWIQRGLVQVGGDHLATDAGGLARAPGIPHGEYLFRLTGAAGPWLAGRVRVQPGPAATNVVLRIP